MGRRAASVNAPVSGEIADAQIMQVDTRQLHMEMHDKIGAIGKVQDVLAIDDCSPGVSGDRLVGKGQAGVRQADPVMVRPFGVEIGNDVAPGLPADNQMVGRPAVFGVKGESVGPGTSGQRVIAGAAVDMILTRAADDAVLPQIAAQTVAAMPSKQRTARRPAQKLRG